MSDDVSRSDADAPDPREGEVALPPMPIAGMRVGELVWARVLPRRTFAWLVIAASCYGPLLVSHVIWPFAVGLLASLFMLERNGLLSGFLEYRPLVVARIEGDRAVTLIRTAFEANGVLTPVIESLPLLAPVSPGLALGYAVRDWGRLRFLPLSALTSLPALLDVERVPEVYLRLLERGPLPRRELDALVPAAEPPANEPAPAWWDRLAQRGTRALRGDEAQALEGALVRQRAALLRGLLLLGALALLAAFLGARAFEHPTALRIGAWCLTVAMLCPLLDRALQVRRWIRALSRDLKEGQVVLIRGERDALWNTGRSELIRLGVIVGLAPSHIELAVAPHSRFACSFCDAPVLASRVALSRVGVPSPSEKEHLIEPPEGVEDFDFDLFWRRLSTTERAELAECQRRLRPSPAFFSALLALGALLVLGEGLPVKLSAGVVLGGALLWGGRQLWRERALEKDVELGLVHVVRRRNGGDRQGTELLVSSRRAWSVNHVPSLFRLERRFV